MMGKHQKYRNAASCLKVENKRFEVLQSWRGAQKMRLDAFYMPVPFLGICFEG